ncbi:two-partner secretion domain-containing protein [Acinetobacter sp. HY1485]|uniref:two-partner secretion domain-containing protein n=1 Tax=Acinetobacter sp. HY1485 TaxID=2970918 RepID=UPI0022B9C180|nr:DUF637 domain-containing protein [Acinetobacter sp. HY1485]
MNKNCYRIIFNKARGIFMAVAENAKSQSKSSGQSVAVKNTTIEAEVSFNQLWQVKALVLSLSFLTPFSSLYAQVQADQSAGANQRAVIAAGKTAAGKIVPVVNIQTPRNGVSHNIYQSFDVLNEGLVLNNSRTGGRSQLVQSVSANPLLQKGEARVILNEVKGGASRFEGNLEVAGQMADVIIANPAGINIKGGGFINTNRATLTTGTPVLNTDGSIQKYNIQQGKVNINAPTGSSLGLGGNKNNANYVDIYTRALDLNAQMHVNADALVVTGANEIDEKTQRPVVQDAKNKASNFAVDVKNLGGMYADNIYLIATEQGLGVQNAGTLQANKNLVITSAGKIENRWGKIETTDQKDGIVSLQTTSIGVTGDINSDGLIQSPNLVSLNSSNDINIYHNQIKTTQDGSRIQLIAEKTINLKPDGKITKDGILGSAELYGQTINIDAGAVVNSQGNIILSAKDRIQLNKASQLNALDNITALTNGEFKATGANITTAAGDIVLQSINEKKNLGKLTLQDTTLDAGGDITFYSSGRIELKDFTFTPILEENLVFLKDINIYTGENLIWSNPIKKLPLIAGNLNVQVEGEANLEQINLETVGNLEVNANSIKVSQTLKSQSDLSLTTQNSDLNLVGKTFEVQDQLELTALKGHVQAQGSHLTSKSAGINIYAQGNVNLAIKEASTTQINAESDIKAVSLEKGDIQLSGAQIKSTTGAILLDSKQDIQAFEHNDQITSLQANDVTFKASRNIDLNNVDINSKKDITINANQDLYLKGINSYSVHNTLISSGNHLYLNSQSNGKGWVDWGAPVTSRKLSLNSQGVLSLNSGKHQFIRNTELKGGAVITNAGWSLQTLGPIALTAQKTDILVRDAIYKPFNGLLQVQSGDHLTINPYVYLINSNGDIVLTSKAGKLTLQHTETKDVNLQTEGGIRLQGADIDIQQASLRAKRDISLTTKKSTQQLVDEGQLYIKGSNIETTQGNINISVNGKLSTLEENNKRTSIKGKDIALSSSKNSVELSNTDISSKGTTELKSADSMMLHNSNIDSQQHLVLDSKKRLYINAQKANDSWATVWDPDTNTVNLNAQGILSLKTLQPLQVKNTSLKAGSILLDSDILVSKGQVNLETTETPFLQKDNQFNHLNGALTIQTKRELLLDPKIHTFNAANDIKLVSENNTLGLIGHGGANGNGSEQVLNLNSQKGSIYLQGDKVDIQGSHLDAAKNINIIAKSDDLIIDGVKNTFTNKKFANLLADEQQIYSFNENQLKELQQSNEYKQYKKDLENIKKQISLGNTFGAGLLKEIKVLQEKVTIKYKKLLELEKTYQDEIAYSKRSVDFFNKDITGFEHAEAALKAQTGNINLLAGQGISISGATLEANSGLIDIEALGHLKDQYVLQTRKETNFKPVLDAAVIIDGHTNFYEKGIETDKNYSMRTIIAPTTLIGPKGVNIRVTGKSDTDNLVLQSTQISASEGDVKIEANKNIVLDAAFEQSVDNSFSIKRKKSAWGFKKKVTTIKKEFNNIDPIGVDIQAKNILIESKDKNANVDIYSANLQANGGNLALRSGGEINLYSVEAQESSKIDTKTKSSFTGLSFIGIKYNKSKTTTTRNQVEALPAKLTADYINTKSDSDTRLEGTEFNYLKGASIEAGGKLILLGAKSTETETLKSEKNYVVWQATQDKGFVKETAQLPTFNGSGVTSTFKAAGGLEVQIPISEKDSKKKELRDEIVKLAKQPGNEYLNDFIKRDDVNWQEIILAQKDWDYKSQGLTAAGAALLAIALAIATGGAGVAALGTTAVGATTTTVAGITVATSAGYTTAGVMLNAAVTSLATQASISLVNNGGDLSKTFKDLGKKEAVKSLVTSVVTAGVLNGLGNTSFMKDMSKLTEAKSAVVDQITGRIATGLVNAGATAAVTTVVNGDSFSDALTSALASNAAAQLQAGLSQQIHGLESNNFDTRYVLHKIAHAASGCVSAKVGQGSCEAGAIGAVVGEVVAEELDKKVNTSTMTAAELAKHQQKVRDISKLAAASVATATGHDVNVAANSAETAVQNNRQLRKTEKEKIEKLSKGDTEKEKRLFIAACGLINCGDSAKNTEAYESLKLLQDLGKSSEFSGERALLDQQNIKPLIPYVHFSKLGEQNERLFYNTSFDNFVDSYYTPYDNKYAISVRIDGGVKFGSGALGVLGAGGLCETVVGCVFSAPLFVHSGTQLTAGGKQVWTGIPQNTATAQILAKASGMSVEKAEFVADAVAMAGNIVSLRNGLTLKLSDSIARDASSAQKAVDNPQCFTAGTLIETSEGLKPIETFTGGELVWSRNDKTFEYGYRPVVDTKRTENQPIFKVIVQNQLGQQEILETTAEHPFWIKNYGWLKASLLQTGMILLDRNDQHLTIVSQHLIPNHFDTVYNIEIQGFHTYHVGNFGIWAHNADCLKTTAQISLKPQSPINASPITAIDYKYVELQAGQTGAWNKVANKPEPNTVYKFDNGYTYKTDEVGRVNSVEANLKLEKNDRNNYQQKISGKNNGRLDDDHGGHLLASMFNGPGEGVNIVPMNKTFNGSSGRWYQLETYWKNSLNEGKNVQVHIQPIYFDTSKRPSGFIVNQIVNGKKQPSVRLQNTPTGK